MDDVAKVALRPAVEQVDRDAACGLTGGDYWNEVKRGDRDTDQIVQAFARHRAAVEAATVAKIVEWLRVQQHGRTSDNYPGYYARRIEDGDWR